MPENNRRYNSLFKVGIIAVLIGVIALFPTLDRIAIPTDGNQTNFTNLGQAYNLFWSTGVINGGDADFTTFNATGQNLTISQGQAAVHIIDNDSSTLIVTGFPSSTVFIPFTTNVFVYLSYDNTLNSASIKVTQNFDDVSGRNQVTLYRVYIEEPGESQIIDARSQNVDTGLKLRRVLYDVFGFEHKIGGNMLGTPGNLNLSVTSGKYYYGLNSINADAFDTSLLPATDNSHHWEYYYQNSSAPIGWTDVDNSTFINNTGYNPTNAGLTDMTNNKFKAEYVYYETSNDSAPGSVPMHLVVIYGQNQYNTQAEAEASSPPSVVPPSIRDTGILIGRIIIQKSNTVINQVDSVYTTQFTLSAATNHNNLAGLQGCNPTDTECYHLNASVDNDISNNPKVNKSGDTSTGLQNFTAGINSSGGTINAMGNVLAPLTPTFSGWTTNPSTDAQITSELIFTTLSTPGVSSAGTNTIVYDTGTSKRYYLQIELIASPAANGEIIGISDDNVNYENLFRYDMDSATTTRRTALATGKFRYVRLTVAPSTTYSLVNMRVYNI